MTPNHDPPPHERVYYKHVDNGQRAYVVWRGGTENLRIDHGPNVETIVALDPKKWTVDKDVRPINSNHLAEVAYVADQMLCRKLAMHRATRFEWRDLSIAEQQRFTTYGPGDDRPERARLFAAIQMALEPFTSK